MGRSLPYSLKVMFLGTLRDPSFTSHLWPRVLSRASHYPAKTTNFLTLQQLLLASLCSPVSEAKVGRPSHHCSEHWRLETPTAGTFQSMQASPQLEVEKLKLVFLSNVFIFIAVLSLLWLFPLSWGRWRRGQGGALQLKKRGHVAMESKQSEARPKPPSHSQQLYSITYAK